MTGSVHRQRRSRTRLLGILSYLALAVLLVGVPVWLATTAGVPSVHLDIGPLWQAMVHRRPGDIGEVAHWLGRVAVALAWVAWVWLTACVVVEVSARRTGRTPVRLPASRSVQCAAAFLVGTAFAVGSLGRAPVHPFAGVEVVRSGPPLRVEQSGPPWPGYGRPVGAVGPNLPSATGDPARPVVVVRAVVEDLHAHPSQGDATHDRPVGLHAVTGRETLWSVAEDHLGSARRWREIAELNYGVPQSDGGSLDGSHWILPGWVLRLPSPTGVATTDAVTTDLGERAEPPTDATPRPTDATGDEGTGSVVSRPGDAARSGAAAGSDALPAPTATSASASTATARGLRGVPVMPLGAGIVGVGVADLVDRLRRVQQRHRAGGERIRMPDPDLRPFEQRLRVGDGAADLDAVEAAVQLLVDRVPGWAGEDRLTGASLDADRVHLTFDLPGPGVVPAPFTAGSDGRSVSVERAALPSAGRRRTTRRPRFVAPTLVSVGRSGGVLAMVAVEGLGSVAIDGDPLVVEGLGRAMALELATSRWAGAFDLVLVGFGGAMAHGDRVSVVAEAGPVIADLSWRRLTASMRLADLGVPSAEAARRRAVVGDWAPVIVVCAPTVPEADVLAVVELAGDGRHGIGVVAMSGGRPVSAAAGCVLRARPSSEGAAVDVCGTVVVAQSVDRNELERAGAVIEAAVVRDGSTESADEYAPPTLHRNRGPEALRGHDRISGFAPVDAGTVARLDVEPTPVADGRPVDGATPGVIPNLVARPARPARAGVDVEVAVLGPVEVRGATRGFTRAWALELVVYLAMHPAGASNEVWATALWPDRLMAPSSLHSTASVARRSLGTARDGSDHLPKSHGRLMLASTVGTDWTRFQELASSDDLDAWEEALTAVRGQPFEGIRATDWALLDGTAPAIEAAVVDVAGRLAGARLREGEPRAAEWAARRGLLVSPYDERLYRMLLRTADAAGNPGGVESVMAELVRVVADEVEPIESVHPSTLALYRSLSRRPSAVLDGSVRA